MGRFDFAGKPAQCECGNPVNANLVWCDWCEAIADEPPHTGHYSLMGTYWCDTCNSPYCDLL